MQILLRENISQEEFLKCLKEKGLTPETLDQQLRKEGWIPLGKGYYKPEKKDGTI